ncbi:MAG TPA: hypothetical protein PLW86_00600, partial [Rhodocyclaceae bacterium]|nr:hypothetical protein [Rhodocyclaceae bacterium]
MAMVKVSAARIELARRLRDNISEHRARRPDIANAYAQLANAVEHPIKLTLWPEAGPRRCSASMVDLLASHFDPLPLIQKALVAMGWKPALTANFVDWIALQAGDGHSPNRRQDESPGRYYEDFSGVLLCAIDGLERLDWGTGTTEEANDVLPAATSAAHSIVSLLRSIAQLDRSARPKKNSPLTAVESGIGHCSVCQQQVYRDGGKTCLEHFRDEDSPAPEAYQAAHRRMSTLRKRKAPGEYQLVRNHLQTDFLFNTTDKAATSKAIPWDKWIAGLDTVLAAEMPHLYQTAGSVKQFRSAQELARWLKAIDPSRQKKMLVGEWQKNQLDGIGNAMYLTRLLAMAERSFALDAEREAADQRRQQCKALI